MTPQSPFDDVAELYDAVRPRYPEALFAELVSAGRLQSDSRLLEIARAYQQVQRLGMVGKQVRRDVRTDVTG